MSLFPSLLVRNSSGTLWWVMLFKKHVTVLSFLKCAACEMNQGTVIAMLPRPFHLKTSNACCGKSQLGSFPHLLEQLPHLFSLGMLPSLYFYLKPGPEAPQVHFLYPVTYAIYIHRSLLWIKGGKHTFGNKDLYFSLPLLLTAWC